MYFKLSNYLSDVAKSMFGSEYLSDIFREACCRENLPGNSLLDVVDPTSFFYDLVGPIFDRL